MKTFQIILGIVLLLAGVVWTLQGFNVLGGSVMSGQSIWAYIGLAAVVVGAVLLVFAFRPRVRLQ